VQHPSRPRAIAVSSAESGDGKSVNAVNLSGVLALNPEFDVLLVDGDLHRSSLAQYFDVPAKPGLADILSGSASVKESITRIDPFPNLYFLPGGKGQRGPADLLNSKRWDSLAEALKRQFSYVIYDTPPAGALADFDLIQANADGVILVVRQDHTNRMLWMRAYQSVPESKLIGVVMNCVKPWFLGRPFGYYYQYYNYSRYYKR
jgi:capsular exopolysaccharide synthesis family protein